MDQICELCSGIAAYHAHRIFDIENWEVVAVCSRCFIASECVQWHNEFYLLDKGKSRGRTRTLFNGVCQ